MSWVTVEFRGRKYANCSSGVCHMTRVKSAQSARLGIGIRSSMSIEGGIFGIENNQRCRREYPGYSG